MSIFHFLRAADRISSCCHQHLLQLEEPSLHARGHQQHLPERRNGPLPPPDLPQGTHGQDGVVAYARTGYVARWEEAVERQTINWFLGRSTLDDWSISLTRGERGANSTSVFSWGDENKKSLRAAVLRWLLRGVLKTRGWNKHNIF